MGTSSTHVVAGCTNSRWPFRLAGMEYDRVRMIEVFESVCEYCLKSASSIAFAFSSGTLAEIQSPAGVTVCAAMPLFFSHVWTASMLSGLGATNLSTYSKVVVSSATLTLCHTRETHLRLGEVLTEVLASWSADVVQRFL